MNQSMRSAQLSEYEFQDAHGEEESHKRGMIPSMGVAADSNQEVGGFNEQNRPQPKLNYQQ